MSIHHILEIIGHQGCRKVEMGFEIGWNYSSLYWYWFLWPQILVFAECILFYYYFTTSTVHTRGGRRYICMNKNNRQIYRWISVNRNSNKIRNDKL